MEVFSLRPHRVPHRWQNSCLSTIPWRGTENSSDKHWENVATLDSVYWQLCSKRISPFIEWKCLLLGNMTCLGFQPGQDIQHCMNVTVLNFEVCEEATCAFRLQSWQSSIFIFGYDFTLFFTYWENSLNNHVPGQSPKCDCAVSIAAPSLWNILYKYSLSGLLHLFQLEILPSNSFYLAFQFL